MYDVIIIGGGHNGLTAAAYLAKAGKKVLVLEKRAVLGGAAATEEISPGYKLNTGAHNAGLFLTKIVSDLNLSKYGLKFIKAPAAVFSPEKNGQAGLTLWRDLEKSRDEIARLSKADSEVFPQFVEFVSRVAEVLAGTLMLTPPEVVGHKLKGGFDWLKPALPLRRLGKHDMMELLRVLPLSVREFLDEWFESEALKGAIGAVGVTGSMLGPMASGTTFHFLYHYLGGANGGFKSSQFVRGGIGKLSDALAASAKEHGAEIRTGVGVARIDLEDDCATGVTTSDGERISAKRVLSNADPYRTFFELVGAPNLGPEFNRKVRNIRYRGTTAKLNLILNGLPDFGQNSKEQISGHIVICPSLEYLERAYDDAKYGTFSQKPYLDIVIPTIMDESLAPSGKHIMSITMQYAPFQLRDSNWENERDALRKRIVAALIEYVPKLPDLIEETHLVSPLDWQSEYGLTEGSIFHGQMALDQLFLMRPVPGWARYRTPIDNLYLCGAGTHPGGGVTGAPGFNAAREVLKSLKSNK